ncbi:hypothetical protein N9908_02905 [Akkermansiaceae bacterium]|nr:hypothetical protein [Akkermansiaceae bacterium]
MTITILIHQREEIRGGKALLPDIRESIGICVHGREGAENGKTQERKCAEITHGLECREGVGAVANKGLRKKAIALDYLITHLLKKFGPPLFAHGKRLR